MSEHILSAEGFEEHRRHLRAVAYRMLGSANEADDAVQETWLRVSVAATDGIKNLEAWLTTAVSRVCLNMLRARNSRPERPLPVHVPDPIVGRADAVDPEHEALLGDSVGLALQVILDALDPPERLAFVLHESFAVPFDEIAPIVERSPAAARQLASRARRRVREAAPYPDRDLRRQREVVDAFFAAAREGDFDALVAVLDPDVVLRGDGGAKRPRQTLVMHGAREVAAQALMFSRLSPYVMPALVNGAAGVVVAPRGRPFSIMGFTVKNGRIVAIDALSDPERVGQLDMAVLGG